MKLPFAMSLALAACAVSADDDLGEVEQAGWNQNCLGCAGNGNSVGSWNYSFSRLDFNGTKNYGAWDYGASGQVALCAPGSLSGSQCTLHQGWRSWVRAGNPNTEILTNVIKSVFPDGFTVKDTDPGGNNYPGAFGLVAHPRTNAWSHADQEIITAATLALLNSVDGVPICLLANSAPNNCVGMKIPSYGAYAESVTFGNAYYGAGRYNAIVGEPLACEPPKNRRYGTISNGSAAQVFNCNSSPDPNVPKDPCTYTGTGETRRATSCTVNGVTWGNPVSVLVPAKPGDWYYNNNTVNRPPQFPNPEQY